MELIARGGRYEGAWDNDKRSGRGTFTWKPQQGTGTHKFEYGTYTGEWCGGKRHGQGVMVLTNGDRCVRHAGGCAGG